MSVLSNQRRGRNRTRTRRIRIRQDRQQLLVQTACGAPAVSTLPALEPLLNPKRPFPNAGLEQAAWLAAMRRGFSVEQEPPTPSIRPLAEPTSFDCPAGLRHDPLLPQFIRERSHGLILRGDGCNPAWLVAQIALAFTEASIVIASAKREPIRTLAKQLRSWDIPVTTLTCRYCPEEVGRVVAGTWGDMAHPPVGLAWRDIVIALDATDALTYYGEQALLSVEARFRLFGLLPAGRRLSPRQRTLVQTTFGFEQLTIPKHGFLPVDVRTAWSTIKTRMLPSDLNAMELKRNGLWLHPARNRRIAGMARALAAGDQAALSERHPEVGEAVHKLYGAMTPHTVLLVESLEHALALAEQLPQWDLITGQHVILDGLPHRQRRLLRRWPTGGGKMIATTSALDSIDFSRLDLVIWAGAGPHLPPLPTSRLICPGEQPRRLLVVDFVDRHHPQLRRWSRQRERAYADAQWHAPGVCPVLARVKRFLVEQGGQR